MKKKIIVTSIIVFTIVSFIFISFNKDEKIYINEDTSKEVINNSLALYLETEKGKYSKTTTFPSKQDGYVLNSLKSICDGNTTISWNDDIWGAELGNIDKENTKCYLYFDKKPTAESTLAKLNITNVNEGTPDFSQVATTDEGIFKTTDGMYDNNTSYYWRGAATTNHVIFAQKCWRIVRINGDGTIRLIYNGAVQSGNTCNASVGNTDSVIYSSTTRDRYYAIVVTSNNASHVGWTYTEGSQRTLGGTDSNAKVQTEKWFNNDANFTAAQREQVAEGKFCNDREIQSGLKFNGTGTTFYYAANMRITDRQPTLDCNEGDIYQVKVAAITADEVEFVGSDHASSNISYYLHAGQGYWTMSPFNWTGSSAVVYIVTGDGSLSFNYVNGGPGLRPVINLRADVNFNSGSNGTADNPYVVQ